MTGVEFVLGYFYSMFFTALECDGCYVSCSWFDPLVNEKTIFSCLFFTAVTSDSADDSFAQIQFILSYL